MTKRAPNVQYLPIDQLVPAEDNFRGPVGDVSELAESIRAVGILQHLVVTPKADGGYRLVFGHRRLEAARQAGLTEVPAEIRDYSDAERFTAMFAENYGRKDLSPLQEARAYQAMLELTDAKGRKVFTQRSLAKRLGVGQAKISNYTGIFKLPERVVTMLEQGELTVTEAVLLVRLAKYPDRVEAALAEYGRHAHKDMDLAVRSQQADLEREERVEQVRRDLQAAGVRLAPDDWREQGGKRLGDGYYELRA
jgi:ParB family chromosome partitioning protein